MSTFLMIHFLDVLSLWRHKKRGKMRPFSFPAQREMQMAAGLSFICRVNIKL